jgi:hypothetical protein
VGEARSAYGPERIDTWTTAIIVSLLALTMVANLAAQAIGLDLFSLIAG